MKLTHILSNNKVNEGVLDDVRARMDARRNPVAPGAAAQPVAPAPVAANDGYKVGDTVEYWTGMRMPQNPRRGTITSIVDKYGGEELTVRTAYGLEELLHTSNKSQMIRKVDSATTPAMAPAVAEADTGSIDPDTKCKTCGVPYKRHFTFDANGNIINTLVRHMTMKDDFPGMAGMDPNAPVPRPTKPSTTVKPTTPDLPRAEMVSTMGMPSQHIIGYKDKTYEPAGPYKKTPAGATGTQVLVPAAAFGIRSSGDVVALLTDNGTAYAEQPLKVYNTMYQQAKQGAVKPDAALDEAKWDPITGGDYSIDGDDENVDNKEKFKAMLDYYADTALVSRALGALYKETHGTGYYASQGTAPVKYLATLEREAANKWSEPKRTTKYFANKQEAYKYAASRGIPTKVVSIEKIDNTDDDSDLITLPVMLGVGDHKKKWMLQFPSERYAQTWEHYYSNVAKILWPASSPLAQPEPEPSGEAPTKPAKPAKPAKPTSPRPTPQPRPTGTPTGAGAPTGAASAPPKPPRWDTSGATDTESRPVSNKPPGLPAPTPDLPKPEKEVAEGGQVVGQEPWKLPAGALANKPTAQAPGFMSAMNQTFNVGDEIMWRPTGAKMMHVPVTVVAVNPGRPGSIDIKLKSPRMIQNAGKDIIRIGLMHADILPAKSQGVAEGEQRMSRAAKGNEKYGKDGMKALAKAGRDGASEKKLDAIRDQHDKYDDQVDEAAKHGLYYNVNKRKAAGTSRPANSPKAPTAQAWKDAAKTAKKESVSEGIDDRGFFNNVEHWHEAKSDIDHDDQWETSKFIVVKNNGKTVAKWSKADNYGWVDSSEQEVAEVNEDVAAINAQRDRAIDHVAAARELAEARRSTPKKAAKQTPIVTQAVQPVVVPKAVMSESLNSLLKSAGLKQK